MNNLFDQWNEVKKETSKDDFLVGFKIRVIFPKKDRVSKNMKYIFKCLEK